MQQWQQWQQLPGDWDGQDDLVGWSSRRRKRSSKSGSKLCNMKRRWPSGNSRMPICLKDVFWTRPLVCDTTHHHLGITTAICWDIRTCHIQTTPTKCKVHHTALSNSLPFCAFTFYPIYAASGITPHLHNQPPSLQSPTTVPTYLHARMSDAKSVAGLFSEVGVGEVTDSFWGYFASGKQFAKRQSMWDAMWVMFLFFVPRFGRGGSSWVRNRTKINHQHQNFILAVIQRLPGHLFWMIGSADQTLCLTRVRLKK